MRAAWDEAGQLRRPLPNARLRIVASGEREERRRRFGQCPLRAPIPVTHELMSVLSKSYQGTTNSISCVTREPTAFCLDFFIFFGIHFSNSEERAEARAYAVFASDLLMRDDPVARLRSRSTDLLRRGQQQRRRLDLNQDLSDFGRLDERPESKREHAISRCTRQPR